MTGFVFSFHFHVYMSSFNVCMQIFFSFDFSSFISFFCSYFITSFRLSIVHMRIVHEKVWYNILKMIAHAINLIISLYISWRGIVRWIEHFFRFGKKIECTHTIKSQKIESEWEMRVKYRMEKYTFTQASNWKYNGMEAVETITWSGYAYSCN